MKTTHQTTRIIVLAGMILLAAASRIVPHLPNFTPMISIALFGGTYFTNKKWAFAVPLLAMLISDLVLPHMGHLLSWNTNFAFFSTMRIVIYSCFVLFVFMGFALQNKVKPINIIPMILGSTLFFYLITNFVVWAQGGLYPMTLSGLITCYVAGWPFYMKMVLSTTIYSALLFGAFEVAQRTFPILANAKSELLNRREVN